MDFFSYYRVLLTFYISFAQFLLVSCVQDECFFRREPLCVTFKVHSKNIKIAQIGAQVGAQITLTIEIVNLPWTMIYCSFPKTRGKFRVLLTFI